jgi:hypothetical protein
VGSWQALRPAAAEEGGRIPTLAPVRQQEEVLGTNARMQVYNEILAFLISAMIRGNVDVSMQCTQL